MESDRIVIIGCSAHGLAAIKSLFNEEIPSSNSYVVVPHIEAGRIKSLLSNSLDVSFYDEQDTILPNRVYISRYLSDFRIDSNELQIDAAMRFFAEKYGSKTVGIVLSGSGSDGTSGTISISYVGGMCFSQDRAQHSHQLYCDEMPSSARAFGKIHLSGSPREIADLLMELDTL